MLIEHGFPINESRSQGEALLNVCRGRVSEAKTLGIVDYLLEKGADPNPPGQTPLHFASRARYARVVERLLKSGADPLHQPFGKNWQPLHEAVWKEEASIEGRLNVARMLVSHGADVNDPGGTIRTTPLCRAAATGFVQMVRFLVDCGADVNLSTTSGRRGTIVPMLSRSC